MNATEQSFFNDLEKELRTAADKLCSALDASVCKDVVLGLIFLKPTNGFTLDKKKLDRLDLFLFIGARQKTGRNTHP